MDEHEYISALNSSPLVDYSCFHFVHVATPPLCTIIKQMIKVNASVKTIQFLFSRMRRLTSLNGALAQTQNEEASKSIKIVVAFSSSKSSVMCVCAYSLFSPSYNTLQNINMENKSTHSILCFGVIRSVICSPLKMVVQFLGNFGS